MPFDFAPTLRGDLLWLRPLREDDYRGLYAIASDPLIWELHPARDRHKEEVFRNFFREAIEGGSAFAAIDARDGKVIGSSRYYDYDPEARDVEIGWSFLARSQWGGAYNRQMKRLMLEHAFQYVDSVVFLVGPQNLRSQQAVLKIGGVQEASRRRTGTGPDGMLHHVYRIARGAFERGPLAVYTS